MSVKSQTKRDSKLSRLEMIVTRHKSAQQKRQLRDNMDRSMTRITQLLKSPTPSKSPQKKSPKWNKSPKKNETHSSPTVNRMKRNDKSKKVWLKPKHELKMVAKANKRKLCTPLRGLKSPSKSPITSPKTKPCIGSQSPVYEELSVDEVIRIMDDTHALDDEDLIEILTCPSPVWWEDPPDPWYTEKPILKRIEAFETTKFKKKVLNHVQDEEDHTDRNINLNFAPTKESIHRAASKWNGPTSSNKFVETKNKTDYKFTAKRRKLEDVLGKIKNRMSNLIDNNIDSKCTLEKNAIDNVSDASKNDTVEKWNNQTNNPEKYNCDDDSGSDLSLHDDNMLKDLENMDIPIGDLDNFQSGDDCKSDDSDSRDVEKQIEATLIEKSPGKEKSHSQNLDVVPKTLPPLQKFLKIDNVSSPVSTRSDLDSCSTGNDNFDTISDTNVKFLDDASNSTIEENKNEELNETSLIILDKIKKFFQKDRSKQNINNEDKNKKEYITVYKIVSEEPTDSNEIENAQEIVTPHNGDVMDHSKINSFYKKRKGTRKKIENSDLNKKSLLVPNSENIKYCFKCSSIFETENCLYCNKKEVSTTHKECMCDKAQCDEDVNNSASNSCLSSNSDENTEHFKNHSDQV